MTTVSSTFGAAGSSAQLSIKRNENVEYSLSGSATATVLLEVDRSGGGAWETVATLDASTNPSGTYDHIGDRAKIRMTCSSYTGGTVTYSFNDVDVAGVEVITDPYGEVLATPKESGLDFTAGKLSVAGTPVTATGAEINVLDDAAIDLTIALAASTVTDGIEATITVKDGAGSAIDAVHALEVWISEASTGLGLTADSTGTVTVPSTGSLLTEYTDDKHFSILTAATGVAVVLLVDSNNPADQYFCVKHPVTGKAVVSAASGTNWEGA